MLDMCNNNNNKDNDNDNNNNLCYTWYVCMFINVLSEVILQWALGTHQVQRCMFV